MESFTEVKIADLELLIKEKRKQIEETQKQEIEDYIQKKIDPKRKVLSFMRKITKREDVIKKLDNICLTELPLVISHRDYLNMESNNKKEELDDIESLFVMTKKTNSETINISKKDSYFLNT